MSIGTAFGVYAPVNSTAPMLITPLYLQPSLGMERKYGQFRRLGIIRSKFIEIRAWDHADAPETGIPLEVLVTDEQVIRSIEMKMDSDASTQDVLLGSLSVH